MAKLYEKLQVMVLSINTLQGHRGELKTQWTEFLLISNPFLYILFAYRNSTIHSYSTEINIKKFDFSLYYTEDFTYFRYIFEGVTYKL